MEAPPATYRQRFTEAVILLCGGMEPSAAYIDDWLNGGCGAALQDFAAQHGPHWCQGIDLLDAAALITGDTEESRWRPIETAPKDVFVLLACPSGYTSTDWVYTSGIMHSDYKTGMWVDHANDNLTDWGMEPTHWRPSPKPPVDAPSDRNLVVTFDAGQPCPIW